MKAQEYLNSLGERKDEITTLNLNSYHLTGEMNLIGFTSLKILECADNQITSLDVSDCPNLYHLNLKNNPLLTDLHVYSLKKIEKLETGGSKRNSISGIYSWMFASSPIQITEKMTKNYQNAQQYLNNLYVFKDKKEIKSINLEGKELEGSLNLKEFPNLELLSLKNNQISEADVSDCRKLKHLDLTENNNLTKLTVYDLNFFERLISDTGTLKKSSIFGGESEWEPQNIGNPNIAPLKITETKSEENQDPENFNENILKIFDLNNVSIYGTWRNNSEWAGIIKKRNWFGKTIEENLTLKEFTKLKKDIIHEIIAKNPTEWEVREEPVSEWNTLSSFIKIIFLAHKSANIERDIIGKLLTDCGKVHYKKGFTEEEWKEIEEILKGKKNNNQNLNTSENKNLLEKGISSPWTWIIIIGLIILFIIGKWIKSKIT